MTGSELKRFWSHVDRSAGFFGCWQWMQSCQSRGYGQIMVDPGLRDVLEVAIESKMPEHVTTWANEVKAGEIGEEARAVLVAIGWLSSGSDPRLSEIEEPAPIKPPKPVSVP